MTEIKETGFLMRLVYLITNQPHKIQVDLYKKVIDFDNKTKKEFK